MTNKQASNWQQAVEKDMRREQRRVKLNEAEQRMKEKLQRLLPKAKWDISRDPNGTVHFVEEFG